MYTKWQLTRGQRGEGEVSDAARAEKERIGKLPVELSGNRGLHLPLTTALTHLTPLYHSRHDRRGRRAGRPSDRSREGRERKEVRLGRCGANDKYGGVWRTLPARCRRRCRVRVVGSAAAQAYFLAFPALPAVVAGPAGPAPAPVVPWWRRGGGMSVLVSGRRSPRLQLSSERSEESKTESVRPPCSWHLHRSSLLPTL